MTAVFDAVGARITVFMDWLLGWSLALPRDATLVVVAVLTSAVLAFVNKWVTDQPFLRQCELDRKRLKALAREAKRAGDKEAVRRYRATQAMIAPRILGAQLKVLLVSLIPIALLATWAFARLGYLPMELDKPVTVRAYYPLSAVGALTHMTPQPGLTAEDGWIRRIGESPGAEGGLRQGLAAWTIRAAARDHSYELAIRSGDATVKKKLLVDGARYAPPVEIYPEQEAISAVELVMRPYRPFGIVPGWPGAYLDPWVVGYLLLAIPFVFIIKRVLGIA